MPGRPRKERIKASSKNNSHVSRVGRVMRCSNYQGIGHNKASYDKEHVPKAPIQRKPTGRTRQTYLELSISKSRGKGFKSGRGGTVIVSVIQFRRIRGKQEEKEYQERLDEEAFQEAMEQQQMNEQMDEERERQNREERE
ncbi:hypothetical protein Tco_0344875 [Tanacetum coccineum]